MSRRSTSNKRNAASEPEVNKSKEAKSDTGSGSDGPKLYPYLCINGCKAAIEWYKKALKAKAEHVIDDSNDSSRVMHAHIKVYNSDIMMSDHMDWSADKTNKSPFQTPQTLKGSPVLLHLQFTSGVEDAWKLMVENGAKVIMKLEPQFWGDTYGQVEDPYGHLWAFGQGKPKDTAE